MDDVSNTQHSNSFVAPIPEFNRGNPTSTTASGGGGGGGNGGAVACSGINTTGTATTIGSTSSTTGTTNGNGTANSGGGVSGSAGGVGQGGAGGGGVGGVGGGGSNVGGGGGSGKGHVKSASVSSPGPSADSTTNNAASNDPLRQRYKTQCSLELLFSVVL